MVGYMILCAWGVSLFQSPWPAPVQPPICTRSSPDRRAYQRAAGPSRLAALVVDPWLVNSARRHAAWMTNARSMTHTSQPSPRTSPWASVRARSPQCLDELLGASGQYSESRAYPDWRSRVYDPRRHDLLVPTVLAIVHLRWSQ